MWIRADAQFAVVVEERGIALGQWEVWSITVRRMYIACGRGKGANQVKMNVRKALRRN